MISLAPPGNSSSGANPGGAIKWSKVETSAPAGSRFQAPFSDDFASKAPPTLETVQARWRVVVSAATGTGSCGRSAIAAAGAGATGSGSGMRGSGAAGIITGGGSICSFGWGVASAITMVLSVLVVSFSVPLPVSQTNPAQLRSSRMAPIPIAIKIPFKRLRPTGLEGRAAGRAGEAFETERDILRCPAARSSRAMFSPSDSPQAMPLVGDSFNGRQACAPTISTRRKLSCCVCRSRSRTVSSDKTPSR